jgi:HIV Tat-specific factor 1
LCAAAATLEDDLEMFQKEVIEAEAKVEALKGSAEDGDVLNQDERPATPPDGEEEFTDDDGTIYKWDRNLRAWVPQVSIANLSLPLLGLVTLPCCISCFLDC